MLLLINSSEILAQSNFNNFSTTTITPDDGLSQGSNYYRYEDSLGFVWITGNDAVNRYDGNYVKVYKKDVYFDNCKNLQQGYGFVEDNHQNIYTGSPDGLYIYKRTQDQFILRNILSKQNDQTIFPIGFVDGKIWCHNKDFNIIAYDVKANTSKIYTTSSRYKVSSFHMYDNVNNPIFMRIPFIDNQQNIWIVNPNGLLFFNTKTKKAQSFLEDYISKQKLEIFSAAYDKITNNLLLGANKNILVFDCKTRLLNFTKNVNYKIEVIAVNKEIIVTKNRDFFAIYNKAFSKIYSRKPDQTLASSFGYSFDKINRLWICRDGSGLMILDFNPPFLNRILGSNELFKTGAGSFTKFSDTVFLINNEILFDKKNLNFEKIDNALLGSMFIKSINDTKNETIWQLSQSQDEIITLYQINKNKRLELYFKFPKISQLGLLQDAILIKGKLLCSFQSGLYHIDIKSKTIKKLGHQTKRNAFKINPISKNRIVVSYLNQEATVYQLDANDNITASQNILNGLQPFYFEENKNQKMIWCGTNNGILVLDANFKIIKKIDANNNLAGTYIYGILLDEKANCWASHQRGLSFINGRNYNIINFTKEDGIQDWDFNNRAYYKTADGTMFFGGMKGFNYFKPPLKYDSNIYKSKVYVDEILINQNKLATKLNNDCIATLNLQANQNNISIHAIIRNIYKGKQTPIVYRINNSKWIYKKSDCTIDLINLAPDTYKLELGVYDKFNNKAIIQKTIVIQIDNPIYRKFWFWFFIVLNVILISGWVYYFYRVAKQKRELKQQLALEQQRNKITADLHDDIGATLSSLQLNSAIANQLIKEDLPRAEKLLDKIENQSKDLADKIGDIIWSMKPGKDEFMTMSSRIKNFANDILGATNIDYDIIINPEIDSLLTDITTRKNIVLIAKEAINNVAKYSQAKNVHITFQKENNVLLLSIIDDGIGFNPEIVKGNGITNMKKRANEINGKFNIISSEKKGTSITLQIPCP